jgi:catechol 2,3-dioxygenase-like lactoylglutathione lyase family enzyme
MSAHIAKAIPILPAADIDASIAWWTAVCGFTVAFRQGGYAGLMHGGRDGAYLHIAQMTDPVLARTVGDQTMVRFIVDDIEAMYADYQQRGGKVHPNGALQTKPWGTTEFAAIDPNGVCVTFTS